MQCPGAEGRTFVVFVGNVGDYAAVRAALASLLNSSI